MADTSSHPARLWRKIKDDMAQCELCNHYCMVKPGARGKCGVRENREGELRTLVYDRVAAINLDPVEKKPLYHFLPGTTTFSLGTMGCNLGCSFCQNYTLSQPPKEGKPVRGELVTPEMLVQGAIDNGARSISYTYSEPTIFFELMQDTARLADKKGLKNIIVSNGFMTRKCLDELKDLVHAANIDLKAFSEAFYHNICDALLKPVLDNLKTMRSFGWWIEITTLLIPGLNDADEELTATAEFIADKLGVGTPWHLSRFHPDFKLTDRPPTPVETLERAMAIGKAAGLEHVYIGNVPGHEGNATHCPQCGCMCVDRGGFMVRGTTMENGRCAGCGREIAGVWS